MPLETSFPCLEIPIRRTNVFDTTDNDAKYQTIFSVFEEVFHSEIELRFTVIIHDADSDIMQRKTHSLIFKKNVIIGAIST